MMIYKQPLKSAVLALCLTSCAAFAQTKNLTTAPNHLTNDASVLFSTQAFEQESLNAGAYQV